MKLLGASTSFAVDQPSPLVLLCSSDTYWFGLRGRFLAHKCIILYKTTDIFYATEENNVAQFKIKVELNE